MTPGRNSSSDNAETALQQFQLSGHQRHANRAEKDAIMSKPEISGTVRLAIDFPSPEALLEFVDGLRLSDPETLADADAYRMDGLDERAGSGGVSMARRSCSPAAPTGSPAARYASCSTVLRSPRLTPCPARARPTPARCSISSKAATATPK